MYCPGIVAINEAYHAGTFDLIDIRIQGRRGWKYRPSIFTVNEACRRGTFHYLT